MSIKTEYSKIIIPSSLHPDTILGIFFLKFFGNSKYQGIKNAKIEIMQSLPKDETSESLKNKGTIVMDLGEGELDHHKKGKILSELVAENLEITNDPAIAKLLTYAKRDDEHGMGTISTDQIDRTFGLSGLISSLNKTVKNSEKIIEILFPILEAHYLEEKKRTTELPLEFNQKLSEGKAELVELRHKGKKIKVVFLESDNISMAGWLKSSMGPKADVVCQKISSGYVNILTKQSRMIDLRWSIAYLRKEEMIVARNNYNFSVGDLMRPGKINEIPEWYYDRATNSMLNGSINPKGIMATSISFEKIKEILKESLQRDIFKRI